MGIIHTVNLIPDWEIINELSQIDKFGGSWSSIEKREGQSLKQLKSIATVRSVGASTRIEGSKMTDDEVEALIKNLEVSKLQERDQQEVVGYFETLDIISESFRDIEINENNIKMLHNILMKHSQKDAWHRGNYKQHSNVVEATNPDETKYIVFKTTDPGFATDDAMRQLVQWYNSDTRTHPIVRAAIFVYDFLSIHPFQDGNGRVSRLLATLLLLRHNYSWIQYVSFEHEIESRKAEYYSVLMQCQRQRPGEDVYPWTIFFLDCLNNIQNNLLSKLSLNGNISKMSPRQKKIYSFVENHPGCQSGDIALKLDMPLPTVKRLLTYMAENRFLVKHGIGKGTNYTIEKIISINKDLIFTLNNDNRKKEFMLMNSNSFFEIKKIILKPLFDWKMPTDWGNRLISQDIYFKISCETNRGSKIELPIFSITARINTIFFEPVVTLNKSINISGSIWDKTPNNSDYPIRAVIEIPESVSSFDFDLMFVYDSIVD